MVNYCLLAIICIESEDNQIKFMFISNSHNLSNKGHIDLSISTWDPYPQNTGRGLTGYSLGSIYCCSYGPILKHRKPSS